MKEVDISTTVSATTVSGNSVEINDETNFYLLEERDMKLIVSICLDQYKEKETHFWALMLLIGLIIGVLIN